MFENINVIIYNLSRIQLLHSFIIPTYNPLPIITFCDLDMLAGVTASVTRPNEIWCRRAFNRQNVSSSKASSVVFSRKFIFKRTPLIVHIGCKTPIILMHLPGTRLCWLHRATHYCATRKEVKVNTQPTHTQSQTSITYIPK